MAEIERLHQLFLASTGVCTDTRKLLSGGLFFALHGPNFDANTFAAEALKQGCARAVVDDPEVAVDDRFTLVPDVLIALQGLARHHRRSFRLPIIAITGTNGKTTTKELAHAVLGAAQPALATEGNLNNHIGVPLTLLKLKPDHRIAIIEMGASKPGDIAELCAIAEPTHGLITNIGKAHLEGFGGLEGVVRTKTELYAWLRGNAGTAFVHGDDPLLMEKSTGINRMTYGTGADNDLRGKAEESGTRFLHVLFEDVEGDRRWHVETQLVGEYNAPNVLAAVCLGRHFGLGDEEIVEAVGNYTPSNSRSQFTDTGRNELVLDAYNANPTSMEAALANFAHMPSDRKKLALLGDMRELGATSADEHQTTVRQLIELGLDAILVGPEFMKTDDGKDLRRYPDAGTALEALRSDGPRGLLILVKGSRGIKLETLLAAL